MHLFDHRAVVARRAAAAGALAPLARSLAVDLERAIEAAPEPHRLPARMTRAGGRCPHDGTLLAFDPFAPRAHRCPRCGAVHDDEAHYRWWLMWHHLWLAERAVHGAVLHLLVGAPAAARFAAGVLDAYADRYLAYPNVDNVLGPSRPFFSTYLESLWLLHVCIAVDALEHAGQAAFAALGVRVRERVIAPSRALIADYPEGRSNRQVWNAAALVAAGRMLHDHQAAEEAALGRHGVAAAIEHGLLADGTWYEGENYHQFAHRGLWYGVTLAEAATLEIAPALRARFDAGFVAPFLSALPDGTLPSRRDSQYATSLHQWRWAESCELGLARRDDPRLAGALARLYAADLPAGDTGRWRTAGEAERNEPPRRLSRAELGWKSLLHARTDLPDAAGWAPGSVLLEGQGLAIIRRDEGRTYVALDYGASGGGHGHPDRLNVLLADGATRWLDDPGTGSYVERTLHWYRSTLAHSAPLVDGRSQPRADGALLGWDERDGANVGGVSAAAMVAPGVVAVRTMIATEDYLVDRLAWSAERPVTLDLPLHVDGEIEGAYASWGPYDPSGAGGLEDGFDFLDDVEATTEPIEVARIDVRAPDGAPARLWVFTGPGATLWRARAPGPPGAPPRRFHAARQTGTAGCLMAVWDLRGVLLDARAIGGDLHVWRADGTAETHVPRADAWSVRSGRGILSAPHPSGTSRLKLPGSLDAARAALARVGSHTHVGARAELRSTEAARSPEPTAPALRPAGDGVWLDATLGEPHYRRSEPTWEEAGRPTARVTLAGVGDLVHLTVSVRLDRPLTTVPAGAENPLDNERAEVNGDGVQLHVVPGGGAAAGAPCRWLVVPVPDASAPRVLATTPAAGALGAPGAEWAPTPDGWRLAVAVPRAWLADDGAGDPARRTVVLDVLVNEMPPGRERRQGQLVLSGARGERVYLQGDRHDPARGVVVTLPAVTADATRPRR